jgi:predicted nucleic acid-binding protein
VRLVISDTGPINYLVLIGHIDILPVLFEKVIMPVAVLGKKGSVSGY